MGRVIEEVPEKQVPASTLDEANERIVELEAELDEANERIVELEAGTGSTTSGSESGVDEALLATVAGAEPVDEAGGES